MSIDAKTVIQEVVPEYLEGMKKAFDEALSGNRCGFEYLRHTPDCIDLEFGSDEICDDFNQQMGEYGLALDSPPFKGRDFRAYRLFEPISFPNGGFGILKAPNPKQKDKQPVHCKSVEFLAGNLSLAELIHFYPTVDFDSDRINDEYNPTLVAQVNGFRFKIHYEPFSTVIEKQKRVIF